jgi:hypothetical protein
MLEEKDRPKTDDEQKSLERQVNNIEQEARMVLPGIQALFGFQLICVFNQNFKSSLLETEQYLHLTALLLVAASAALVVTPAAYHRQANHHVSHHFIKISSRYLAIAMWPLAIGICLDIDLITRIITNSNLAGWIVSALTFIFYSWNWFIFPRLQLRRQRPPRIEN